MYCVTFSALSVVTVLVTIMGIMGYLAFFDTTEDLILLNLPIGNKVSTTAKFLYVITISGSTLC